MLPYIRKWATPQSLQIKWNHEVNNRSVNELSCTTFKAKFSSRPISRYSSSVSPNCYKTSAYITHELNACHKYSPRYWYNNIQNSLVGLQGQLNQTKYRKYSRYTVYFPQYLNIVSYIDDAKEAEIITDNPNVPTEQEDFSEDNFLLPENHKKVIEPFSISLKRFDDGD
jgi:hypothetical protein